MGLYAQRSGTSGLGVLKFIPLLRFWRNPQLRNIFDAGRVNGPSVDDAYHEFPRLARWAAAAVTLWALALLAFVSFTVADLDVPGLSPAIDWWAKVKVVNFRAGAFRSNLPGRMVAITFAVAAVTYYMNCFATLAPKTLGSWVGRAWDRAMRATTIGLWIPIMWALIIDPRAWPICAGLGTILIVINNWLALRIAEDANQASDTAGFSTRGDTGWRFVEHTFREWWKLMGAYSLSLLAIGVLLTAGLTHDGWLLASFVTAINVFKIYRLNCVEVAPRVRGSLARDILTLRRAAAASPVTTDLAGRD